MIKNEREYHITRAQAERFERALAQAERTAGAESGVHPLLQKAQTDALRSQLADLRAELAEYEALRAGRRAVPDLTSFADLPRLLIQRRIAAGLSQKDLADRLGLKEQQMQRYEATDYASASFTRLLEVIRALEITPPDGLVSAAAADVSMPVLLRRLDALGLDRQFVTTRLFPRRLRALLDEDGSRASHGSELVLQAADYVGRALRLPTVALLGATPPRLETAAALSSVRFKVAARVNRQRLTAYTVYAHYLALLLLEATPDLQQRPIPTDAARLREDLLAAYGSVTLEHVLRYIWDLGVPVLPLRDRGAFHGACWRTGGRTVIVLKQQTRSPARWAFDGLHELHHTGQMPEQEEFALVEAGNGAQTHGQDPEEQAASQFAGDVMLAGRAEELAHRCAQTAGGDIRRLKTVVPAVAAAAGVQVDALANYVAYRLSLEGHNWWATAAALQADGTDPWAVARDVLLERVDLGRLNDIDRDLLSQALAEAEV